MQHTLKPEDRPRREDTLTELFNRAKCLSLEGEKELGANYPRLEYLSESEADQLGG